jgi:hypothetical protein
MKSSLLEYPLKVFILEDQAPILDDCVGRMERSFRGGLLIEKYECRMDALEAIRRADRLSEPYDAAILDLKVPDHPGEDDYADMRVPKLFFELFGSTKTQLLQWTAYPEDKAIAEFIRDFGLPKQGHTYEVLSKENIDWPYIMKDFLLRASAEKHLGRVLDDPSLELLRSEEGVGCGVGQRGSDALNHQHSRLCADAGCELGIPGGAPSASGGAHIQGHDVGDRKSRRLCPAEARVGTPESGGGRSAGRGVACGRAPPPLQML